ncbi:MAG: hypothetical protein NC427_06835 [Ruminococcus flavefaciens]|nr:hypothetical protein [Ruminococcus flavefaciens]
MADNYQKTRVDTFLTAADGKLRDAKPFGHTDKAKEDGRKLLIEAAQMGTKFSL